MPFANGGPESGATHRAEYSRAQSERHGSGRKIRTAYFGLASLWGFIIGAGGVLGALQAHSPASVPAGSDLTVYLVAGLLVAVAGGALVASAYQEARRRKRQ